LALNFKNKNQIIIDFETIKNNKKISVDVWDDTTQPVTICNKEVNEWFSEILQTEV